ncbi:MAG: CPBP family intramembrane metalloprotease [Clostridia bacterium]|nr:CPBP family intramembrane metalloprotease [Clostridia bacterium]MBQ7047357.1 CPBP family intramembrane metalloprotease [Clostridia bacterium]
MEKIFKKHETLFCILLIVLYVVTNSFCVQNFGYTSCEGFILNTVLSLLLLGIILILKRSSYYGLTKVKDAKKYLYFLPLVLIASVNLWNGFNTTLPAREIVFYILTMINVGFIEEIIFRGFLFRMMEQTNLKAALLVSSVTFGIGHIVNLLNGAELLPTLIQICYAVSIGYLFVIIFHKSKSLLPCIITHSAVNALSVFNVENTVSLYVAPVFLITVPLIYALYINKTAK